MILRRKVRILALQALYEIDCAAHPTQAVIDRYLEENELPQEGYDFFRTIVTGVIQQAEMLDAMIHEHAPEWPVAQLSVIDRNILRIAIFELTSVPDTPLKVAINEAVELAKAFGTESTSRFVNGVLGGVTDSLSGLVAAQLSSQDDTPAG